MSPPRFLIDENLSTALPRRAHAYGYEASHITQLGLKGAKDWTLMELVAKDDWVLVTNNAVEFRGRYRKRAERPQDGTDRRLTPWSLDTARQTWDASVTGLKER